jgi:hypothetical protein
VPSANALNGKGNKKIRQELPAKPAAPAAKFHPASAARVRANRPGQ